MLACLHTCTYNDRGQQQTIPVSLSLSLSLLPSLPPSLPPSSLWLQFISPLHSPHPLFWEKEVRWIIFAQIPNTSQWLPHCLVDRSHWGMQAMYDMMQLSSRCLPVGLRVPEENGFPYEDILLTRPIFPEIYMYNDVLLLPGILISEVVTIQVSKAKPLSERKTCTCT